MYLCIGTRIDKYLKRQKQAYALHKPVICFEESVLLIRYYHRHHCSLCIHYKNIPHQVPNGMYDF